MIDYIIKDGNIYIKKTYVNMDKTLDCGQAFRWTKTEDGIWTGIAFDRRLDIAETETDYVLLNTSEEDFLKIWYHYFDLDRDYSIIDKSFKTDKVLCEATKFGSGIRILNQEPWETLCSFIISQNNNIKRIKGIIERLCENFGERSGDIYKFPTAEKLSRLNVDDLQILRCGFRAKYIIDAAKKVADKTVNLAELKIMPTDDARAVLTCIYGVGDKVADCTLLFGLEHFDAFPKDVWIKRAMQVLFGGELPKAAKGYEGIAQQYIFYYARETKLNI